MDHALAPGTRLGPYEIETLIGAGGMGHVYRARDPRLGRSVAIKTLAPEAATNPDGVRRFETEARSAGTLDHPNLLVVYDVGRESDVSYIVSELLDGETLRARLQHGALTERQAIDIAVQIANGLAAAHARGIIHRDLKPENLFITRDRRVKILDFGIAKLTAPPDGTEPTKFAETLTAVGALVGTIGYMAPEQVVGGAIDHRADIFALGAVLHEMLTGARAFHRDTPGETLAAILNGAPSELPSTVSRGLVRIVDRCLEKRPEDRFHSTHDLALALDLLTTTTSGGSAAAIQPPRALPRRKLITYGASTMALLASGFATGSYASRAAQPATSPSFRRLTFRRGLIRSARVAPDGQTVLYGALWDGDRCRVHSVRTDGPESSPLDLPDANVLAISRTGELALALGQHLGGIITYGTLARVPMTGGAPRELIESVKFADWSPDGTELAIVRRVDGRDRLEYPIGNVLVEPKVGERTGLGFARVSPDGRHVAFVSYPSPGSLVGRVCIVDQAGRVAELTSDYINVHGLTWNRDEIWYTAANEGPLFRALCAVTPDGDPRTITRTPGNATLWDALPDGRLVIAHTDDRGVMITRVGSDAHERDLSWLDASRANDLSRDGRLVLFSETGQGAGPQGAVYLRGTDGSAAIRLGAGAGLSLSPDTRWAICATPSMVFEAAPHLDIVPTGAGEPRRLDGNGVQFIDAMWLPDGRRIIAEAFEPGTRPRLYVFDVDSGNRTSITPEGVSSWALSPDGSMIAVSGTGPAVLLYPVDGGPPREVPNIAGGTWVIGWIDDGLLIVASRAAGAEYGDIHKVDVGTGRGEFWQNIMPNDPAGIMLLLGLRATPDGRTRAFNWHRALSNLYVAEGLV